ncbi:MAG: hypothetical protein AB1724_20115 [Thermodesulfobacteriota bacterium]
MKTGKGKWLCAAVVSVCLAAAGCVSVPSQQQVMADFEAQTGLTPVQVPNTEKAYLGKTHRGYKVLYHAEAPHVWGRYATRVTMGEIGREAGGLAAFLTGQGEYVGNVTGSPLDRLLSQAIGQPLSVTIVLTHNKPKVPRLDVLSSYANVKPDDLQPEVTGIGFKAGSLYAADKTFGEKVAANAELMKRLKQMRCEYIRLDQAGVSFFFAGSETDYSGMINDMGGFNTMINAIMDSLADIADAI